MPLLFEPFSRSEAGQRCEGLGLGLYIASQIATAHNGSLSVTSDRESGTCLSRGSRRNSMGLSPWPPNMPEKSTATRPLKIRAKKTPTTQSRGGAKIGWLRPTKGALSDTVNGRSQMQSWAARSKLDGRKFEASRWRS